jgi:WD40 repeat protein
VLKQTPLKDAGGLAQDGIVPTSIATGAPESFYGNALALSPDGTQIAVEDISNSSIRILDVKTGKEIKVLAPQFPKDEGGMMDNYIHGMTYSPDGSLLVVASYDKTVRLWDVTAGKELKVLTASGQAATVTFSADGMLLASSTTDGQIDLWGVK